MKTLMQWVLPVVIVLAGLLGAKLLIESAPEVQSERPEAVPPLVRVTTVHTRDVELVVEATGRARAARQVVLTAEVGGRVLEVAGELEAGDFVEAGATLVRLDERDYALALARAEGEVVRAEAALIREEAEAELARADWERSGRGEATPLALRQPQIAQARADLASAEAAVAAARLDLERTTVVAPFAARVRSSTVEVGQLVTPGLQLALLDGVDAAEVTLKVPDFELGALELVRRDDGSWSDVRGPEVVLRAEFAGAPREWTGRVIRSEGVLDERSLMWTLVVEVQDPYGLRGAGWEAPLPPGLFLDGAIRGRTLSGVFAVPRSALRGADHVLVVDDEDRLRQRRVEILRRQRETLFVRGLEDGARVCVSPMEIVVDGMRVRPVSSATSDGDSQLSEAGQ